MSEKNEDTKNLRDYFRIFWMRWPILISLLLMGSLAGFGLAKMQNRVYESTGTALVQSPADGNIAMALTADSLAKSKAKYYVLIGGSQSVASLAAKELKTKAAPESLLGRVKVENPNESPEIRVTAQGSTPEEAKALAAAWIKALTTRVAELEKPVSSATNQVQDIPVGKAVVSLEPTSPATLPGRPASPNVRLYVLIGGLVGLLMGILYALLKNNLDRKIRSAAAVEKATGSSVLGSIPLDNRLKSGRRIVETGELDLETHAGYAFTEALRELRTNLSYVNVDSPPRVIVVTSSVQGEGKSSITANLALAIAATGTRVTVMDGDLRRPVVAGTFGLVDGVGLTNVISGQANLEDVLQYAGKDGMLQVLGSGPIPPNPSELLGSQAMSNVLAQLAKDSLVLIDAPPLLPVTDASIMTVKADGALIVARAGHTDIDELAQSVRAIHKVHGNILGIILNQVPTRGLGASQYGYYGKRYYAADPKSSTGSSTGSKFKGISGRRKAS